MKWGKGEETCFVIIKVDILMFTTSMREMGGWLDFGVFNID
jgi:hypothetical protein